MKLIRLSLGVIAAVSFLGNVYAQNSNVVSAAIEYKKYPQAMATGDMEKAKKVVMEAKSFIDPAMKHEDTKNDEKAHYYNGVINFALIELSTKYEDLKEYRSEETMEEIKSSFKIASEKRRYQRDIEDFVDRKVGQAVSMGKAMFDEGKFEQAFLMFSSAYELTGLVPEPDEERRKELKNNAIVSARNQIKTLKDEDKSEEALDFIDLASEAYPKNADIAIEGVNLSIENDDRERAEKYFKAAAEADPENKALFSTMGSIYLSAADKAFAELQKMEITDEGYGEKSQEVEMLYGKAEKNLKRALEIDENYLDAAYNLGVLYLGRADKLARKANQMDFNNPDYQPTIDKSDKMYENAIEPFETYIEQDPNNTGVLQVLFQVHKRAGNSEKAMEYKKKKEKIEAEQKSEE